MSFDPQDFVAAQEAVWPAPLEELRGGRKATHWIWYVFPQIAGLGRSEMARRYALADLDEAGAYLAHAVLGPRLIEACKAMLTNSSRPPEAVLGEIDAVKIRSSATLFAEVPQADPIFEAVLSSFYGGARDPQTLDRLGRR